MAEYLVIILAFTYMLVNFFFTSFSKKTKADKLSLKAREAIRDGNFEIAESVNENDTAPSFN